MDARTGDSKRASPSKNYRSEVDLCGPLKLVDDDGLEAL